MNKTHFLQLIKKDSKILAAGILLGLALYAVYMLFIYMPMYKAEVKLFIRNIPQNDVVTNYQAPGRVTSESGYSNPLFNMIQILSSEKLAEEIYETIRVKYKGDLNQMGVYNLGDWKNKYPSLVSARILPSTDIIDVQFEWLSKQDIQPVTSIVIDKFKKVNLDFRRSIIEKQRDNLKIELEHLSRQLDETRTNIKNYKMNNQSVNFSWNTSEVDELVRGRVSLEQQATDVRSKISFNQRKFNQLSRQLGFADSKDALRATGIGQDGYLIQLNQSLAEAEQKLQKLSAKFTDKYPEVIAAQNEIDALKKSIATRTKETLGNSRPLERAIYDPASQQMVTEMAQVQSEISALQSQYASLSGAIGDLRGKEKQIPSMMGALDEIQKDEPALVEGYSNAKEKYLQAIINERDIVDNIFILETNITDASMLKTIAIGLLATLLLSATISVGIIWVKDGLEDKWHSSEEIEEETNQRVLGVIPWVESSDPEALSLENPVMKASYNNIANRIISQVDRNDQQAVSFVMTQPTRVQSKIVPNVAQTLIAAGKTVVLVDTDFENPSSLLKYYTNHDLVESDLISLLDAVNFTMRSPIPEDQQENEIRRLVMKNLVMIPTEFGHGLTYLGVSQYAEQAPQYINSGAFKRIMDVLKKEYDIVLVDTPAKPLIFSEVSSVVNATDAMIVLADMNANRETLKNVLERIEKWPTPIIGITTRQRETELQRYFDKANRT